MNVEPVRLRLDPAPARAVGAVVEILSGWMPIEHLRLGGGTALDSVVMVGTNHIQFLVGDVPVSFVGTEMRPAGTIGRANKPACDRIASQVWQEVLCMIESNLEYVPPLAKGDVGHPGGGHGR